MASIPGVFGGIFSNYGILNTVPGPARRSRQPTANAACYLTSVSGNMDGAPEKIRIYPAKESDGREWWWVEVTKGSGGSAFAEAECVYYDQRLWIVW